MPAERPLSPHLQIYRLPMAAVLSISHRISGALLSVVGVLFALLIGAAAYMPEVWYLAMSFLSHPIGGVFLIGVSFALAFHLCTGIRHLIWDTVTGLNMNTVQRSNWMVLLGSIGLTVALWIWVCMK